MSLHPARRLWCAALILCAVSVDAGDWPQWLGPDRNGHAPPSTAAPEALPPSLQPVWRLRIGGGFSSPIVAGDKVVYLDEQNGKEVAHLVAAASGKEIWQMPYADAYQDEWGTGPRSTPVLDGDLLYVQACNGEFRCLRVADGTTVWGTSFEKDFGVKFLGSKANSGTAARRGNNGSGLIDHEHIILPVGNTDGASLVCFNKRTGDILWKSQNDEAAYSSPIIATLAGVEQIVAFTADALLAVRPDTGELLWRVPLRTAAKRHAATPIVYGGDCVVVNSHTFGTICIKITREGTGFKASTAWQNRNLKTNLATPVLVDGYLYNQGAQSDYVCVDADTGKLQWSQPGFGQGQKDFAASIAVGNKLLVLAESGQLFLLEATPQKYTQLGQLQVCGHTWSSPAFANGRIYVRDPRTLTCIQLVPDPS